MANPTTNFGWVMPTATDLVTDLPADFAVFGQGVDTSMAYLLGGTTGQILSKTSATNMAFTWINNDQGDITGITATSPLTGGGSSGAITVGIQDATTSVKGSVQLSDSTSTTSSVLAATPTAVKAAYDLANAPAASSLTGATLASGVTASSLTSFGTTPTITSPKINLAFNAQTGTTYTLAATDSGKLVTSSNGSPVVITIPASIFAAGEQINVQSIGVGLTTISGGAVTITSTGASAVAPILRARYSAATIICTASNVFTVIGDLA